MAKTVSPDRTVENAARAAGANVQVMWIMNGPKDTQVACIECLLINRGLVLIETFKEGGWDAFTGALTNSKDETVADVLNRCGVPVPKKFAVYYNGNHIGFENAATVEGAIAKFQDRNPNHNGRYSAIEVA